MVGHFPSLIGTNIQGLVPDRFAGLHRILQETGLRAYKTFGEASSFAIATQRKATNDDQELKGRNWAATMAEHRKAILVFKGKHHKILELRVRHEQLNKKNKLKHWNPKGWDASIVEQKNTFWSSRETTQNIISGRQGKYWNFLSLSLSLSLFLSLSPLKGPGRGQCCIWQMQKRHGHPCLWKQPKTLKWHTTALLTDKGIDTSLVCFWFLGWIRFDSLTAKLYRSLWTQERTQQKAIFDSPRGKTRKGALGPIWKFVFHASVQKVSHCRISIFWYESLFWQVTFACGHRASWRSGKSENLNFPWHGKSENFCASVSILERILRIDRQQKVGEDQNVCCEHKSIIMGVVLQ